MTTLGPDPTPDGGLDPDPTPTATPWEEYLATAQSLDAIRRELAAEREAATGAASTARAELARVTADVARQRAALTAEAARLGLAPPKLDPTPAERAAAGAALAGAPMVAVPAALGQCRQLLGTAEAQLHEPPPDRSLTGWPPPVWLLAAVLLAAATGLACAIVVLLWLL